MANAYQNSIPVPFVPGSDFAGTVVEVGDRVLMWSPGDRVFGSHPSGAFAEFVRVGPDELFRSPTGMHPRNAAGLRVAYATAMDVLRWVLEVQAGQWLVVTGAAGGVGLAAIDLATRLGVRIIACARGIDRLALCGERGAEVLVDPSTRIRGQSFGRSLVRARTP
ncbi:NADPH:quinone reductase-like Zn-dependent oxidoreductase [Arthrobacter sp. W4I7]|nr:NADPH:quinone reductase-like Zn-dependent oxidoreductase [Arthrobacter sp. W4I7]